MNNMLQLILGSISVLTGTTLVMLNTQFGRNIDLTPGVLIGSVMIMLGMTRIKQSWANRKL